MTDPARGPTTAAPTGSARYELRPGEAHRCDQCGRVGTRGFEALHYSSAGIYGHIIQCASRSACRRRYERQRPAWLDE